MAVEIYITVVLALSAVVFNVAGFGFGLLSVPLLSMVMPIQDAVALQFPFSLALVVFNAWRFRSSLQWRLLTPLVIGAALSQPLGLLSLTQLPAVVMKRTLAAFIFLAVANNRFEAGRRISGRWARSAWWGGLMGLISGWFSGAYTTGGPPAVVFCMAAAEEPQEAKGMLGAYFTFLDVFVLIMYAWAGLLTWPGLVHSAWHTPSVALGMLLGGLAAGRLSMQKYRLVADALLVVSASLLWIYA